MTPNLVATDYVRTLPQRVDVIRRITDEKVVSIADAYTVWEQLELSGIDRNVLLSYKINHPTITGHTIFAMKLIKLFDS